MGEGGALLIRNPEHNDRAEIIREKGTNRQRFLRGQVDKYTWEEYGSSYLPSDMNAAYLWGQLQSAGDINRDRLASWSRYRHGLSDLAADGRIGLPFVPDGCEHNAHMFYIKAADLAERTELQAFLKERGIATAFHYVPLHSSPAGRRYGRFHGDDEFTTKESDRLLRLPMYYGLAAEDVDAVVRAVYDFYARRSATTCEIQL